MRAPLLLVLVLLAPATLGASLPPLPDPGEVLSCLKLGTYRAVWEIQGKGDRSPFEGETLGEVRGVVTADFQRGSGGPYEPRGFFLQAHEGDCDDATSDGIFVYTGSTPRAVGAGDLVRLDGARVVEYQGPASYVWEGTLTELTCLGGCTLTRLAGGHALPAPIEYAPPSDPAAAGLWNEAREGMLARVSETVTTITPTDRHHDVWVVRGVGVDRLHAEGGPAAHRIQVEGDGIAAARCGQDGPGDLKPFATIPYDPANGTGILGPVTYGFNTYKILQDDDRLCPRATPGDGSSYEPSADPPPVRDASTLTVATLNAYNFFDATDDPRKRDPVASPAAYTLKTRKLAALVCDPHGLAAPDIIALQEVENDAVLSRLASQIATDCGATYAFHTNGAADDRGIENAYLVRADRVQVLALVARQACSATDRRVVYEPGDATPDVVCPPETPHYLHPRHPLEITVRVTLAGTPREITLLNNHLKSKLGSSVCSVSDCTDWRILQAEHLDALVDARLAADPDALVLVLGDLNDHYGSEPLARLVGPGHALTNAWSHKQGPPSTGQGTITRYSYVHQGLAQTLDHVLYSPAFARTTIAFSPRHVSTDQPGSHERDASMYAASDHDPALLAFRFAATG